MAILLNLVKSCYIVESLTANAKRQYSNVNKAQTKYTKQRWSTAGPDVQTHMYSSSGRNANISGERRVHYRGRRLDAIVGARTKWSNMPGIDIQVNGRQTAHGSLRRLWNTYMSRTVEVGTKTNTIICSILTSCNLIAMSKDNPVTAS